MARFGRPYLSLVILAAIMTGALSGEVPKIKLNNGKLMPAMALGTFLGYDKNGVVKSENKRLRDVVIRAIDVGYRHIDTAFVYDTEEDIGEAIRMKIDQGAVQRHDVFVTTKLWNTHHKREQVPLALKQSLDKLGLNYVDLYLMHWPIGLNVPAVPADAVLPGKGLSAACDDSGFMSPKLTVTTQKSSLAHAQQEDYSFSDVDFMETWRGLEDVQRLGLAKSIGVSNFNLEQLKRVTKEGVIKPAAIQVEIHPQIVQSELIDYARSAGIAVMAFSPFGSIVKRFGMQFPGPRIDEPVLVDIAKKYNKTTPQVLLRWLVDKNVVPIPKTTNYKRLEENINIFDFKLEQQEIDKINRFDENVRYTFPSFWQTHPYYPFEKVENPLPDPFIATKV